MFEVITGNEKCSGLVKSLSLDNPNLPLSEIVELAKELSEKDDIVHVSTYNGVSEHYWTQAELDEATAIILKDIEKDADRKVVLVSIN